MKDMPINIKLEGLFFQGGSKAVREEIRDAWRQIHRKGTETLGNPHCVSLEPYLQWVQTRAIKLKMSYPRQEILQESTFIYTSDANKLRFALEKANQERRAWRNKYQSLGRENAELQKELKEKSCSDWNIGMICHKRKAGCFIIHQSNSTHFRCLEIYHRSANIRKCPVEEAKEGSTVWSWTILKKSLKNLDNTVVFKFLYFLM